MKVVEPAGLVWGGGAARLGVFLDGLRSGNPLFRVAAASGYFNPLHPGHLAYLGAARRLGDCLVVVVNSDAQVARKGSVPFMPQAERLAVVASLWGVHFAVLSEDAGRSVARTLELLRPDVFANGGDAAPDPDEATTCARLGVRMEFGVGGSEKVQSSSRLIERARKYAAAPLPGGV